MSQRKKTQQTPNKQLYSLHSVLFVVVLKKPLNDKHFNFIRVTFAAILKTLIGENINKIYAEQ